MSMGSTGLAYADPTPTLSNAIAKNPALRTFIAISFEVAFPEAQSRPVLGFPALDGSALREIGPFLDVVEKRSNAVARSGRLTN
jgi:hypothetical protein